MDETRVSTPLVTIPCFSVSDDILRKMDETRVSVPSVTVTTPCFDDDILTDILTRLPAKVLQQFKLVSKHWQSLIRNPHFVNLHFSRSKTRHESGSILLIHPRYVSKKDVEEPILFKTDLFNGGESIPLKNLNLGLPQNHFEMLKPVNGLVCLRGGNGNSVLVYNPCTGEKTSWIETSSILSLFGENLDEELHIYNYFGFGFDPTSNKHKVVRICEVFRERKYTVEDPVAIRRACEVMTVGDNTWRKIDEVPPPYNVNEETRESLYVNGFIYWVDHHYPRPKNIMAFDVASEKFRVIETPGNYYERVSQKVHLVEVDGCMALLDSFYRDIFLMIFDGESWIDEELQPAPLPWDGKPELAFQAIPGTDEIILESDPGTYEPRELIYFDRKKKSSRKVQITGDSSFPSSYGNELTAFVESVFPVQD